MAEKPNISDKHAKEVFTKAIAELAGAIAEQVDPKLLRESLRTRKERLEMSPLQEEFEASWVILQAQIAVEEHLAR